MHSQIHKKVRFLTFLGLKKKGKKKEGKLEKVSFPRVIYQP